MLGDLYDLLEMVANRGHLVPFIAGSVIASALTSWLLRKWPSELGRELRDRIEELEQAQEAAEQKAAMAQQHAESMRQQRDSALETVSHREGQCKALEERLTQTSEACERLVEERTKLSNAAKLYRRERNNLAEQTRRLSDQIDSIAADDGRFWLRPKSLEVAEFVPLGIRRVPIVSVANLKGGVGKTTITANLGITFAASGLRVLMIDLDHQSSLSSLCMNTKQRLESERTDRTISRLFRERGGLATLNAGTIEIEPPGIAGRIYLAPTRECLADIENQLAHRWAAGLEAEDVRLILRRALHDRSIADDYDLVLIDCPPRLTTGCVNALAASDYVLIPVLLQDTSAEAVPRMLSWLRLFRDHFSEHLDLAGIVGNRAFPRDKLIAREKNVWEALRPRCSKAWGHHVPFLNEIIREHATCTDRFASLDAKHRARYEKLAQEIREALPHACLRPPAVHPLTGPAADGVGH